MAPKRSKREEKEPDVTTEVVDLKKSTLGGKKGGSRADAVEGETADGIISYSLPFKDKSIPCRRYNTDSSDEQSSLIFTHGAGGGIENPATVGFAKGYAALSPLVLFQGTMNLQNRVACFKTVLEDCSSATVLGGRSMGARAAVLTAKDHPDRAQALVLVSFPLTSAKGGDSREDILLASGPDTEILFISGDGDSMCHLGNLERVRKKMKARTWLVVVQGADHGMSLKDKRGVEATRAKTGEIAASWTRERDAQRTELIVKWDPKTAEVVVGEWRGSGGSKAKQRPAKADTDDQAPPPKRQKQKGT